MTDRTPQRLSVTISCCMDITLAMEIAITEIREVGIDAIAIDFETPSGFDARPGQFVRVRVEIGDEVEYRSYTISSPFVDETFEITVDIDPRQGTVAPKMTDLEAGDTMEISGPHGNVYYEDENRVVVLAGGPGVGPAVGIAERALADGNDAAIVYQDSTLTHERRLEELTDAGAFVWMLDQDDDLVSAVVDALANGDQVFVYGFADFVSRATEALAEAGVDTNQAKIENFG